MDFWRDTSEPLEHALALLIMSNKQNDKQAEWLMSRMPYEKNDK